MQVSIEPPPTFLEGEDPDGFRRELLLARAATSALAKARHLRRALRHDPRPEDIRIEYQLATNFNVFAGTRASREEREAMWAEATALYEHIVKSYDHMQYYARHGGNIPYSPEVLVPTAAVRLGYRHPDPTEARQFLYLAMVCLKQTHDRRKKDWENEPEPRLDPDGPLEGGEAGRRKWESRLAAWRKRKADAAAGEVLKIVEMELADAAVKRYARSFKPQKASDALRAIIRDFHGTPMASIAGTLLQEMNRADVARPAVAEASREAAPGPGSSQTQAGEAPRETVEAPLAAGRDRD